MAKTGIVKQPRYVFSYGAQQVVRRRRGAGTGSKKNKGLPLYPMWPGLLGKTAGVTVVDVYDRSFESVRDEYTRNLQPVAEDFPEFFHLNRADGFQILVKMPLVAGESTISDPSSATQAEVDALIKYADMSQQPNSALPHLTEITWLCVHSKKNGKYVRADVISPRYERPFPGVINALMVKLAQPELYRATLFDCMTYINPQVAEFILQKMLNPTNQNGLYLTAKTTDAPFLETNTFHKLVTDVCGLNGKSGGPAKPVDSTSPDFEIFSNSAGALVYVPKSPEWHFKFSYGGAKGPTPAIYKRVLQMRDLLSQFPHNVCEVQWHSVVNSAQYGSRFDALFLIVQPLHENRLK